MKKHYSVEQVYDNSWKVKHKGNTFAAIEGIDKIRDGKQVTKGIFNKKPVSVYRVVDFPHASDAEFLTLHSAATHAITQHSRLNKPRIVHPIRQINNALSELQELIFKSASDPRMKRHQEKLLEVSKAHANTHNTFKHHFKDDLD